MKYCKPLMASQASFCLLCVASSSGEMSRSRFPLPLRSADELVSLIQSIREWPGLSAVLFRGLPESTDAEGLDMFVRRGPLTWHVSRKTESTALRDVHPRLKARPLLSPWHYNSSETRMGGCHKREERGLAKTSRRYRVAAQLSPGSIASSSRLDNITEELESTLLCA